MLKSKKLKQQVLIASDHAGFERKTQLIKSFDSCVELLDLGVNSLEKSDYPDQSLALTREMKNRNYMLKGILICGTGIGMSIAANRHKKIRAALCCDEFSAEMSRRHNDANVLILGSRIVELEKSIEIVKIFLETKFDAGRHLNRINKLEGINE